jgi:hypothetical protein
MRCSLRISMFIELLRVSTNSHAPSLQVLAHGSRCEHMRVSHFGDPALFSTFSSQVMDHGRSITCDERRIHPSTLFCTSAIPPATANAEKLGESRHIHFYQ